MRSRVYSTRAQPLCPGRVDVHDENSLANGLRALISGRPAEAERRSRRGTQQCKACQLAQVHLYTSGRLLLSVLSHIKAGCYWCPAWQPYTIRSLYTTCSAHCMHLVGTWTKACYEQHDMQRLHSG
jgi:hypothetical protein